MFENLTKLGALRASVDDSTTAVNSKLNDSMLEDLTKSDALRASVDDRSATLNLKLDNSMLEILTKFDALRASVDDGAATVNSKLDAMGAVAGKCLLLSAAQAEACPRLVWIEEDNRNAVSCPAPSRFSHFRRKAWDKILRKDKQAFMRTRFRVRFLCAHDLSLAECGHDGKGYLVEMKDWQRWLQRCLPVLQVQ